MPLAYREGHVVEEDGSTFGDEANLLEARRPRPQREQVSRPGRPVAGRITGRHLEGRRARSAIGVVVADQHAELALAGRDLVGKAQGGGARGLDIHADRLDQRRDRGGSGGLADAAPPTTCGDPNLSGDRSWVET